MSIQAALHDLIETFEETTADDGTARARGTMRLGAALEGPPGRLHGGHHAYVRTLPIVERFARHASEATFPCAVDVTVQRGLELDRAIPFTATYRVDSSGWRAHTEIDGTRRLGADIRSIDDDTLASPAELRRWRELYQSSLPSEDRFNIFGVPVHFSRDALWIESEDPLRTLPDSQHAALVESNGMLGAAFLSIQVDTVGASARGTMMRHPHFTKRIEIQFATGAIPAETRLVSIADRTRIEEDETSESEPVEAKGVLCATVRIPVLIADAGFERAYATGTVTAHPVDPEKFEQLKQMRQLRKDAP